jgi:hypothetical protein
MRTSVVWVVVLALLLVSVGSDCADGAGKGPSLQIDPLLIERKAAAGSQLKYEINVENLDPLESVTLEASVVDIEESERGAYVLAPAGTTSYSIARWTSVSPTRFTIPPGGLQRIEVTVSVPRGTAGGRYGAVAVTTVPERTDAAAGAFAASTFTFRMASFIELEISGSTPRLEAYAESFEVTLSGQYPEYRERMGEDALVFTVVVKNESNVHVITKGNLTISTADGRTVARYPLGGGRGVVLPDATVGLRSVIRSTLPPGEYTARAVIDYGARRPIVASTTFAVEEGAVVTNEAQGASLQRFSVSPVQIDMTLRPGAMRSAVVEVANRGEDELVLTGQVLPLAYDELGNLLPSEDRAGGLDWVTISPQEIRVRPGLSTRVRLTAQAPRDANGGYYADIVFSAQGSTQQTESGSSLFVFVGESDATVAKRGTAQLTTVAIEEAGLSADVRFLNEGNVHMSLSGELFLIRRYPQIEAEDGQIIRAREEQVASVALDTSENPVLPQTQRLLRFMMPVELEDGEYELAVRVDYGGYEPAIARLRFRLEGGIASEITE